MMKFESVEKISVNEERVTAVHPVSRPHEAIALIDDVLLRLRATSYNPETHVCYNWQEVERYDDEDLRKFLLQADRFLGV